MKEITFAVVFVHIVWILTIVLVIANLIIEKRGRAQNVVALLGFFIVLSCMFACATLEHILEEHDMNERIKKAIELHQKDDNG